MISPIIFKTKDKTYRVKKMKWGQTEFEDDTAYIMSDFNRYVYPYRPEVTDPEQMYQPGIYLVNNKPYILYPKNDEDREIYSKNKMIVLTPDSIFNNIGDNIISTPIDIATDGDTFKPIIRRSDDIALAGMKYVLSKKEIDFNNYSDRFPDVATKNNTRRAITHGKTLKMDMCSRLGEVFDVDFGICFWDKPGCINPIDKTNNNVYIIYNNDPIDIKNRNFVQISSDDIIEDDTEEE